MAAFASFSSIAAAECDFYTPTGQCQATIQLLSTGGSKPSYTAEISVRSSASSCSKVEYYLDNTPHTTVLGNRNSTQESLFGTKPITRKGIEVAGCTVYAEISGGHAKDIGTSLLNGTWAGPLPIVIAGQYKRNLSAVVSLKVDGGRLTGTHKEGKSTNSISGAVNGNAATYTISEGDISVTYDVSVTSDGSLAVSSVTNDGGIVGRGVLPRQ